MGSPLEGSSIFFLFSLFQFLDFLFFCESFLLLFILGAFFNMAPKKKSQQEAAAAGTEEAGEHDTELASVAEDTSLESLRDLFRTHLAQQHAREVRMQQEASRQWKTVQHQFSLLQREVYDRTTPDPGGCPISGASSSQDGPDQGRRLTPPPRFPPPGLPPPSRPVRGQVERDLKLQCLNDSDDIEHYLITFERVAVACQWPTTDWAVRLAPLLTGKARAAYVSMDHEDALEYEQLKAAILDKYDINQETHRLQFREAQVGEEETPKELYVRLRDSYQRWVQPRNHTKEQIGETIILEQFLRLMSPELQVWIRERNPDCC